MFHIPRCRALQENADIKLTVATIQIAESVFFVFLANLVRDIDHLRATCDNRYGQHLVPNSDNPTLPLTQDTPFTTTQRPTLLSYRPCGVFVVAVQLILVHDSVMHTDWKILQREGQTPLQPRAARRYIKHLQVPWTVWDN